MECDDASFLSFFRFGNKAAGAGGGRLRFVSFALEIRQRGLVEGDYASFLSFYRFGNKAAGAGGGRLRFVSCFLHASFHALFMFRFLLSLCFVSCFLYALFHSLMRRSAVLYHIHMVPRDL